MASQTCPWIQRHIHKLIGTLPHVTMLVTIIKTAIPLPCTLMHFGIVHCELMMVVFCCAISCTRTLHTTFGAFTPMHKLGPPMPVAQCLCCCRVLFAIVGCVFQSALPPCRAGWSCGTDCCLTNPSSSYLLLVTLVTVSSVHAVQGGCWLSTHLTPCLLDSAESSGVPPTLWPAGLEAKEFRQYWLPDVVRLAKDTHGEENLVSRSWGGLGSRMFIRSPSSLSSPTPCRPRTRRGP